MPSEPPNQKPAEPARTSAPYTFSYSELLEILAAREAQPPVETREPTLTEDDLDRMFG